MKRITTCAERPGGTSRKLSRLALLVSVFSLITPTGCGDQKNGTRPLPDGPTLAYVVTECSDTPGWYSARQELRIQQPNGDYVTIAEFATPGPVRQLGALCEDWGQRRWGLRSVRAGAFQRMGMSSDGSLLVFEVTDDFSVVARNQMVPAEQEGIFVVRTDGSGLRRLGDASRNPCFRYDSFTRNEAVWAPFNFTPDDASITFTDIGPGPEGDSVQIFTMDLTTGERRAVTRLPPPQVTPPPGRRATGLPAFVDADTISFFSYANPIIDERESNQAGERRVFSIKTDSPDTLRVVPFFAEPGSNLIEDFQITGGEPVALALPVKGDPENGCGWWGCIVLEVFVLDGENVLQLTAFERSDTLIAKVSADRQRVFFFATDDPFGRNPVNTRQIFSVDRLGGDLRQLTDFESGQCHIYVLSGQDPATGWIVFSARSSRCASPDSPPVGAQVFAIHPDDPDGTAPRQLTRTRGMEFAPDGTVTAEFIGPWVSPRPGG